MRMILALLSCTLGLMLIIQAMSLLFRKENKNRPHLILGISAVFFSAWAFSYAVMYSTTDISLAAMSYRAGSPGWTIGFSTVIVFFNMLFCSISGRKNRAWANTLLVLTGCVFFAGALSGRIVASDFKQTSWGWEEIVNPGSPWVMAYGLFIISAIINIILRTALSWKKAKLNKHRMQLKMIGIPFAILTIPTLCVNYLAPVAGIQHVPPVGHFVICGIMYFICESAIKYRMLSINPEYAAEALLFDVSDYVFLTDYSGKIRKAGGAALKLLETTMEEISMKEITEFIPGHTLEEISSAAKNSAPAFNVEINAAGGIAVPAACKATAVMDTHGDLMGYLLVMNDLRDLRELEMKTAELKEANVYLKIVSATDPLTGIFNRKRMHEDLDRELNRFLRSGSIFSVIMMDIDNFKKINDKYGHATGDNVLKRVAESISTAMRKNDVVARWGGEEFLILCVETREKDAVILAERIRAAIESADYPVKRDVTASFGVAEIILGESIESLIEKADQALYVSKEKGRNMVTANSTSME